MGNDRFKWTSPPNSLRLRPHDRGECSTSRVIAKHSPDLVANRIKNEPASSGSNGFLALSLGALAGLRSNLIFGFEPLAAHLGRRVCVVWDL